MAVSFRLKDLGILSLKVCKDRTMTFISLPISFSVPNPLGVVGVLSAFNFPVAVYGWCINCNFIL
jgi:hypothetical protein